MSNQIDIQEKIKEKTFRVLQKYYQLHYSIKIRWDDLKTMDQNLLEAIDYDKMKDLKGYHRMSFVNFKKLTTT